jgi:SAM-dependent methyltransferase
MARLTSLLLIALIAGCDPGTSQGELAGRAETPQLRAPDVRYEPTPQRVVHRMLDLAGVGAGDVVYDLGSGDGRIPITAARRHGARGVGIDIDPKRIAEAEANAAAAGVTDRVTFRNEDLLLADFRDATVVTLFLSPELNERLQPKLVAQLRPGTRIVSYYHDMPGWQAQKRVVAGEATVSLWVVGRGGVE